MSYKSWLKNLKWNLLNAKETKELWNKLIATSCTPGEDKVYYVISRTEKVGLFSYVETTLRHVAYAIEHKYIPVVDMRGIPNSYVDDDDLDVVNMWTVYFEQPIPGADVCNLESCEEGNKIVKSNDDNMSKVPYRGNSIYMDESSWFWSLMYKHFFRLNDKTSRYIENEYDTLLKDCADKTMGVLVRGTDFKYAKGHNVQPEPSEIIECVKKKMKQYKYSNIYLATDERRTEELFVSTFGADKIIVNKRVYYDDFDYEGGLTINDVSFERSDDKYLRGLEYLSSIMLLSKCDALIGGMCGGSIAAFYINGGQYRDVKLFDLGMN